MISKLGMKHLGMELYTVCINHDPGKTLIILWQYHSRSPMHLNGKKGKCHLMAENMLGMSNWTDDLCL